MTKHLFTLFFFISLTTHAFSASTAENDTLLRVLREELSADFDELQQQDVKPYFISFRVQEICEAQDMKIIGYKSLLG
ncbi:MAG: hypothetical protein IJ767_02890 [Bacteroidaceae bacterium]|nr:hypothetical protein [Bacteroidaceae bacterium]MBR1800428.1 hypothetical protein [Bacteroidaceae bacterium]